MASRRFAAILLLSVLLAAAGPASAAVDPPLLTVGDFWTYRTNTSVAEGFYLDGTATFRIEARESVTVEGVPVDGIRISIQGSGAILGKIPADGERFPVSGTWVLVGEDIFEVAGLKVVSSVIDLRADGETEPFSQPFSFRVRNTTTFRIVNDAWRFPVDVGDSGAVAARFNATEDVTFRLGILTNTTSSDVVGERTLTYVLEERRSLTVPVGSFEAYLIRETWPDGHYNLLYFVPAVGNNAKTESLDAKGVRVATTELSAYRYQAREPPRSLGLTLIEWSIITAVAAVVVSTAAILWRRRRRTRGPEAPPAGPP